MQSSANLKKMIYYFLNTVHYDVMTPKIMNNDFSIYLNFFLHFRTK